MNQENRKHQASTQDLRPSRNAALDVLRITAMLLVVMIHILGRGGVLKAAEFGSPLWFSAWYMEIVGTIGVNLFGMITGYFCCKTDWKPSRLYSLWLQTAFYSISFFVLDAVYSPSFPVVGLLIRQNVPLPFISEYWYVLAYVGLFIFMPFINKAIASLTKSQMKRCLAGVIVLGSISFAGYDKGSIAGTGYNTLWLGCLYFMGAYIRLHGISLSTKALATIFAALSIVSLVFLYLSNVFINNALYLGLVSDLLQAYTSPVTILIAICVFVMVSRLTFAKASKFLSVVSSATFGVYLFHVNPFAFLQLKDKFAFIAGYPVYTGLGIIIASVAAIFAAGVIVDLCRQCLFKMCKTDHWAKALENLTLNLLAKLKL